MKVSDVMTAQVVTAKPATTVQQLAKTMAEIDSGVLPIVEDGKVVGLVTDRDIVVRVIAAGGDLSTPVSEIMTDEVHTCREDDNLADATAKMAAQGIRRLLVLNEHGNLCGIVSLGDIALDYGDKVVGHTLEEISAATVIS